MKPGASIRLTSEVTLLSGIVIPIRTVGEFVKSIDDWFVVVRFDSCGDIAVPLSLVVEELSPEVLAIPKDLISQEIQVMRQLFFDGPTCDGDIISKEARKKLVNRKLAEHEYGYAWLNRYGCEIAIRELRLDKAKESRDLRRRLRDRDIDQLISTYRRERA